MCEDENIIRLKLICSSKKMNSGNQKHFLLEFKNIFLWQILLETFVKKWWSDIH